MSNVKVLTCLACGKRKMFEVMEYGDRNLKHTMNKGCECGQNEFVLTECSCYANAKKLVAMPLKEPFKLMYQALLSKRKMVELVIEMIDTLTKVVKAAEFKDDTEPLKECVMWLRRMTIREVNKSDGDKDTKEEVTH